MTTHASGENTSNDGVAAVDRALSILDAFTENDIRLTLTELSKRTGLYKSTTLRLAESLEKFGYLRRDGEGYYKLGSKPLHLGTLYQRQFRTVDIVPPVLREMVTELREGASFYVREGDTRVCLHRVDAPRAVRDSVSEGDRLPINVGAAGHVFLAYDGLKGARYDEIRKKLYSASFGERDPETAAVACPVFGLNKNLAGVLAVSGPRYRLDEPMVHRILPVLFRQARELTRAFGGDPSVFDASDKV